MKRTADTNQRQLRWSLACAHLGMPAAWHGDGLAVRPAYLINRFASRGSAVV